jgi:uncharacterized protein (TIGR02646 family)
LIKLNKLDAPVYLSAETVTRLTGEFISSGKNVWNHEHIKKVLLQCSDEKCAYCECKVNVESNYMEVEHFEDKANNPNKVVQWDNLLPSCKRCNGSKGTHDVISEPIINPFNDDPREHLKFKLYRFTEKSQIGKNTIDSLSLNHSERAVFKRYEIGEQVMSSIETAWERYNNWCNGRSTRSKNILIGGIDGILLECQPNSSYAATASTVLHNELRYKELRQALISSNLWGDELEELHKKSSVIVLECA